VFAPATVFPVLDGQLDGCALSVELVPLDCIASAGDHGNPFNFWALPGSQWVKVP
jgi:hypothetical protein